MMKSNPNIDFIETDEVLLNGTIVAKDIEGIFVDRERYGSSDNNIIYDFRANSFEVKYQDTNDKFYEVKLNG